MYHPSFAGATGGGRLAFSTHGFREQALYGNHGDYILPNPLANTLPPAYNKKAVLTSYLSYDHLIKGIGLGIGLKNQSSFYELKGEDHILKRGTNSIYGIDVAVSPKFVLKNGDGKTRYTLSPSLLVGYSRENSPFKPTLP